MKVTIVGFSQPGHMGRYLTSAAKQLRLDCKIMDAADAEAGSRITRSLFWHVLGRRPARLDRFCARVFEECVATLPSLVLTTGCAPLNRSHIEKLRREGIKVVNYSTDDPWNPALRARWFLSAIPSYDAIFTPRRANIEDFRSCGVRNVHFLPFAYDPKVHAPWPAEQAAGAASDVLFVGGCDADRLPMLGALVDAGLQLALFGNYWGRHSKTRSHWRGIADQDTIRAASAAARVCLCLVRRANRDGHVMRSYEAAAIGGCILAEDTPDHRELFGPEDQAARYFKTIPEMVEKAKLLVADIKARRRLSLELRNRVAAGCHAYADRLDAILRLSKVEEQSC